ncbi:MAG: EB domain-containing protein [Myxococcales bacterium]|nr:EB domain-containing protein [Myxococcales bacterium]
MGDVEADGLNRRRSRAIALAFVGALQLGLATTLAAALLPTQVAAQGAEQQVDEMNRQAMEAYNALDIERAGSMLEDALRQAYQGGVSAPLLARTNLNLGIVYIGGLSDNDTGLNYFVQAVCLDPSIQLDPLMSSPDIQRIFGVAQQQAAGGGCPAGGPAPGPQPGPGGPPGPMPGGPMPGQGYPPQPMPGYAPQQPMPPPPDQALMHVPPMEQLAQTPLPLYLEINPLAQAKKIFLYYKGLGMEQFKRVPMFRYQGGYAYQISCGDVWEPHLTYYVEAQSADGRVVGVIASAAQPIDVPIVAARTQAEPALPGATPPASCGSSECPPGVKGCEKRGKSGIGESCSADSQCQSGLECLRDECALLGAGGTEVPDYDPTTGEWGEIDEPEIDDPNEFKRFFVQLGLVAGLPYVTAGMPADRPPPDNRIFVNDFGGYVEVPEVHVAGGGNLFFPGTIVDPNDPAGQATIGQDKVTAWEPDQDSGYTGDELLDLSDCSADGTWTGPRDYMETGDVNRLYPSKYCVRVKSPGIVPTAALRFGVGYFITDKISLAVVGRYQFSAGLGTFANMLVGARGEYMLTAPRSKGLMASAYVGGTFGQIQARPPATGSSDDAPFATSGLMGGHVGANLRYRLMKNFGFYMAPEIDVQFPTILFNIDLTLLGVEVAF